MYVFNVFSLLFYTSNVTSAIILSSWHLWRHVHYCSVLFWTLVMMTLCLLFAMNQTYFHELQYRAYGAVRGITLGYGDYSMGCATWNEWSVYTHYSEHDVIIVGTCAGTMCTRWWRRTWTRPTRRATSAAMAGRTSTETTDALTVSARSLPTELW